MLLHDVVAVSARVGSTRARLEKHGHLAELLRRLEPAEIDPVVAWLSGELPQGRIGLGPAAAHKARPATSATIPALTVAEVDRAFAGIAELSGPGSNREKAQRLGGLLARGTGDEQEFLFRLVLGELRQGALAGLMAEALSRATEAALSDVRRALMLSGDLRAVARALLTEGPAALSRFRLELFRPLQPMLAQPAHDLNDAMQRLGRAALEYKLDGARVQVHREGDTVRIFSRRLNEVTAALPELVEGVRALPAERLLLDGEVLALHADGTPQPFQVTMRRFGRRLDVEQLRHVLPLTPFWFDALLVDDDELIDRPADERFARLERVAPGATVPRLATGERERAAAFLGEALAAGHEGIMAKAPDSSYEAGGRGNSWLKVKQVHTLDLVVLAAEWGSGRRKGWLSNLHLGARDPVSGEFVMLGKTFKGLTDKLLRWQTEKLRELATGEDRWTVHVRPELVVEIAFNDVQDSPQYPAGLALRFARVKRYREDKTADQADTLDAVRAIHRGRPQG